MRIKGQIIVKLFYGR